MPKFLAGLILTLACLTAAAQTCVQGAQGSTTASLSWTASATAGVTYNVYTGQTATALAKVQSGITGTTATVTGVAPGTWYYYVTAEALGVESQASNTACKTFPAPVPAAPTSLTVS